MKKGMTITYEVDTGLYINLTNKCTNRCEFCIRNNDDGAYGSDTLWLEREPTAEEVIENVFSRDLAGYTEIVFCGYGEPTCRLDVLLEVARAIKEKDKSIRVRLNTNGHSNLINGRPTEHLFSGLVDVMSISLNTPTAERYVGMCHPVYKEKAFSALLDFTRNVKNYVQKTTLSVVRQSLGEDELAECRRIADELGVTLKVRDYISA